MSRSKSTTRRQFIRDAGLWTLGASLAGCAALGRYPGRSARRPPNIVFILADDLGWGELGCYGNTFNESPNIDRLAAQGLRFTEAYAAAPVCSPTRGSILTGQYPQRFGVTDFLSPKSTEYLHPETEVTLNEALARAGYHTGIVGKWHLNTQMGVNPGSPKDHGFDEVLLSETKPITELDYFYPYYFLEGIPGKEGDFLTVRLGKAAVDFVARNHKKPFFLYLSFYAVHAGLDAPREILAKYQRKYDAKYGVGASAKFDRPKNKQHRGKPDNPYIGAMLEIMDDQVGRVVDQLVRSGIADDTLVVFFSDNGGGPWDSNNGGLRTCKTWLYEGGIRDPLIMRYPRMIKPGRATDTPVCSIDFYPTIVDLAGAGPVPDQIVDGVSLLPLLKGKGGLDRDALYWNYTAHTAHWKNQPGCAIREGDFKLLQFYKDGRIELYNLRDDPQERHNLADELPGKRVHLFHRLQQWKHEIGAVEPTGE